MSIKIAYDELVCNKCGGFKKTSPYHKRKKFLFVKYREKVRLCEECFKVEQREYNLNRVLNG